MSAPGRRRSRAVAGCALAAVLLTGLTACGGAGPGAGSEFRTTRAAPSPSPGEPSAPAPATAQADPDRTVRCAADTCSLTLTTDRAGRRAFGTLLTLDGVEDGRATLTVGDAVVTCTEGEGVEAGPLTLRCTGVSGDGLTVTAEVG